MAAVERLLQQAGIARRERVPDERHLQGVVAELALLERDVLGNLVGVHDGLRLEQQGGRGDAADGVEGLQQQVRFGQGFAARAELLPDERDGVHAQNLDALVGEEEHLAGHRSEDGGVGVVEVPLEAVEGRPDPPPAAVADRHEGAGVVVGEDLAHRLLVLVGHRAVGEDPVVVLELLLARECTLRPLVLVRGVVEDEVDDEGDAVRAQVGGEGGELLHIAERGAHLAVARHGVAAVAVLLRGQEQGHEVQVGEAQFAEVRDARAHALKVGRVPVHVADAPEHAAREEPVGVLLAGRVERTQVGGALLPGLGELHEQGRQVLVRAV